MVTFNLISHLASLLKGEVLCLHTLLVKQGKTLHCGILCTVVYILHSTVGILESTALDVFYSYKMLENKLSATDPS